MKLLPEHTPGTMITPTVLARSRPLFAPLDSCASSLAQVTNDAMRDHINELLPRRAFARWRHSQIVPFTIEHYALETPPPQSQPPRTPPLLVNIAAPPLFTPEAQRLNGRWHIPIPRDADVPEWLCCAAEVPSRPAVPVDCGLSAAAATAADGAGADIAPHFHTHAMQAEEETSTNESAGAQ